MQKRAGPIFRLKICYSRTPDAGLRESEEEYRKGRLYISLFVWVLVYQDFLLCPIMCTQREQLYSSTRNTLAQRVLNVLLRARLSRGRMIWLLAHLPLPLYHQ